MRIQYPLFLVLLFCLNQMNAIACYNEYYTFDESGKSHHIDRSKIVFNTNFDRQKVQRNALKIAKKFSQNPSKELLSDYALALVQLGNIEEAEMIFAALAKEFPNEYALHANLGTTYELLGKNEKALEHIERSLVLNPRSHGGSEWIHVNILKAKIARSNAANESRKTRVLNLSQKQMNDKKTLDHLMLQLKERFPFSGKNDEIMAELFCDLGDCYAQQVSFEYAKAMYQIAKEYFGDKTKKTADKIEQMRTLRATHSDKSVTVLPTHQSAEYMIEVVKGVPYLELLVTHTNDGFKSEKLPNTSELVAQLIAPKATEAPSEKKSTKVTAKEPNTQKKKKETNLPLVLLSLIGGLFIFVVLILWARKKRG